MPAGKMHNSGSASAITRADSTAASLAPRQGQPGDISTTDPRLAACSTTCASTYPIYDLCTARQAGCEQICYLANWDLFTQCQQCLLDQTDQVNQGMLTSAQGVITKLATACTNNGTAVTPVQMTA